MVEIVVYKGEKFRRYPESKHRTDRVYFTPGIAAKKRGVKRLHEEIWMDAHGPIPQGHHIHHKDDNPLNNELANLECLAPKAHAHEHAPALREARQAHIASIRPLTKAWHGSPEGIAWHTTHGTAVWEARPEGTYACESCGGPFTTKAFGTNRFCSNKCKTAWRRKAGLDDEQRACTICGASFTVNRYSKVKTCSRACGGKSQSRTKSSRRADAPVQRPASEAAKPRT